MSERSININVRPNIVGGLIYVAFGYLWGMLFSNYIFADLPLTIWTNVWVYVCLLFWPFCLFWYFIFYVIGGIIIIGLIYLGWDEISTRFRNWNHHRVVRKIEAKRQIYRNRKK